MNGSVVTYGLLSLLCAIHSGAWLVHGSISSFLIASAASVFLAICAGMNWK